jgi:hypothetical protein
MILPVPRRVLGAAAAVLLALHTGGASGCGFEDPSSVSFQRGVLNLAFPKALWVSTAVWQAQSEGLLTREGTSTANRGLFGYRRLSDAVDVLAVKLDAAGAEVPSFTLVMIGPVLWVRFADTGDRLEAVLHVKGPSAGDVVVVSDEPVIRALAKGELGADLALSRGLLRLYGNPSKVAGIEAALRAGTPGTGK